MLFLRSKLCLACRLKLKWSQNKSMHKFFTCFECVLMMWSDCRWYLEGGANLILVEDRKYKVEMVVVWCTLFVNLVYTLACPFNHQCDQQICDLSQSYPAIIIITDYTFNIPLPSKCCKALFNVSYTAHTSNVGVAGTAQMHETLTEKPM